MRTDILNHRDISLVSFINKDSTYFILNVYSDSQQNALTHLKNTETNLSDVLIMTGDFNIRDSDWDPFFPYHSPHTETLLEIADNLGLQLSNPSNPGPTRYADNPLDSNSVIDLMFLQHNNSALHNHIIIPNLRNPSDHAPLAVEIAIQEEINQNVKSTLVKDSDEEADFLQGLSHVLCSTDTTDIHNATDLESAVNTYAITTEALWFKYSKCPNITRHSKEWWNSECTRNIAQYHLTGQPQDWSAFKKTVKDAKRTFFDEKIQEIAALKKRPWDLMNWVKKRKLPTTETLLFNNRPCTNIDDLWNALHSTYNSAQNRPINPKILQEIPTVPTTKWPPFSVVELCDALIKCNNSSTPGPDHISWRHLKTILHDPKCAANVVNIANACIRLRYWPKHFKKSTSIIIPKPNKANYSSPKSFRPIVLLNTMGKLIEKMISKRLQIHTITSDFLHPNQLGGIIQRSPTDAGVLLTHVIRAGWIKGLRTSVLAFDIAQFFPSLNHQLLPLILAKAGLDANVVGFLSDYLIGRHTQYVWNSFISPLPNRCWSRTRIISFTYSLSYLLRPSYQNLGKKNQ